MKLNASLLILCLISCSSVFAQQLKSKEYVVSISNVKMETGTMNPIGTKTYRYKRYTGNYVVNRKAVEIARQSFSTLQLDNGSVNVNITNKSGYGNTVTYNTKSKKMEYKYTNSKVKKPKNDRDIILAAIMTYFKAD
jgi:hypothetical protein